MCSMSVICPLCAVPSFANLEQLQQCLIKAANGPLSCPFDKCQEQFLGLDKLTIHLFTHTTLMTSTNETIGGQQIQSQLKIKQQQQQQQLPQTSAAMGTIMNLGKRKANKNNMNQQKNIQENDLVAQERISICNKATVSPISSISNAPVSVSVSASNISGALSTVACDICEFTFRNVELRDMHFRLVHENFENSSCTISSDEYSDNMNKPTATTGTTIKCKFEPFKCHLCAKTFKMKGSLRLHLKVMHMMGLPYMNNNSTKLNICDRIRYKETSTNLTSSLKQQSSSQQQPQQQHDAIKSYQPTLDMIDGTSIPVPIISTTTPDIQVIDANSNLLSDYNAKGKTSPTLTSLLPKTLNESDSKDSIIIKGNISVTSGVVGSDMNPKIWECDVCSKSFTTKYFLKKHKRLHTGEMPYTCEICARTFTFQQSYHKHLLYHSEVKPHVCSVCGRAFKELSTLHNHERIHSGEKPFKCEVCGKCFRQRVSFLVHTRIHTGVMPYKCNHCQKSFRYKVSQRTHKCVENITESITSLNDNIVSIANGSRDSVDKLGSTDHFIKELLETNASASHNNVNVLVEAQLSPTSAEIVNITDMMQINKSNSDSNSDDKKALEEALLTKAIDDIVIESCQKLGIGYVNDAPTITTTATTSTSTPMTLAPVVSYVNEDTNLSLEKLESLRLYSPLSQLVTERNETIVMFDQFLLD